MIRLFIIFFLFDINAAHCEMVLAVVVRALKNKKRMDKGKFASKQQHSCDYFRGRDGRGTMRFFIYGGRWTQKGEFRENRRGEKICVPDTSYVELLGALDTTSYH